jgi:YhcH/YjgK/YiaL family protein
LYAVVVKGRGVGQIQAKMEAHRRYIDIQYALSGTDLCGWVPTAQCGKVRQAYDPKGDCELFYDQALSWVALPPGHCAIFFPWDGHAPMAGEGDLHKVVIKVAVAWDQP